jgi:hypothetical protein
MARMSSGKKRKEWNFVVSFINPLGGFVIVSPRISGNIDSVSSYSNFIIYPAVNCNK